MAARAILIEADGYTDVSAYTTHRFSMGARGGYVTKPTDAPPNTWYRDRGIQVGALTRQMFRGGVSGSGADARSQVSGGQVELVNRDGGLNGIFGMPGVISFRDRELRVLDVVQDASYATAALLLRARIAQEPERSSDRDIITIADRMADIDSPHLTTTYGGTNALPAGVDGTTELAGKLKPRLWGKAFQIPAVCVNTSKLIYQVNDGAIQSIDAVADGGDPYSAGSDYTSQADMEANAPSAGQYRVWKAGGMFRIGGSTPLHRLTCDATAHTSGNSTAAQLIKPIVIERGWDAGDVSSADVTALDAANSAVLGIWVMDDRSTSAICDELASTVGAYYGPDLTGTLRMARLDLPSGTAAGVLATFNTRAVETVANGEDIPTLEVRLRYARYYATLTGSEVSGSVTSAATRADLAEEWRTARYSNTISPNPYKRTKTLEVDTCFAFKADADAEAARRYGMVSVPRRTFLARDVDLSNHRLAGIDLNAVLELRWHEYGFSPEAGVPLRLIGIENYDLLTRKADLRLWGAT